MADEAAKPRLFERIAAGGLSTEWEMHDEIVESLRDVLLKSRHYASPQEEKLEKEVFLYEPRAQGDIYLEEAIAGKLRGLGLF